jgi:Flp pilus assembly protein protease CpaA
VFRSGIDHGAVITEWKSGSEFIVRPIIKRLAIAQGFAAMGHLQFPGPISAWAYWVLLLGLLLPAAVIDWRTLKIPKHLSLSLWVLGPFLSIGRGAFLGALGIPVFTLSPRGAVVGAIDGLLFSLAGFALGFVMFFILWLLRACGGGDVKLFAGIGAFVGPIEAVRILVASQVVIALILIVGLFRRGEKAHESPSRHTTGNDALNAKKRKRRVSYSFPLFLATGIILLWDLRSDLRIAAPKPDSPRATHIEPSHEPSPPTDR